MAPGYSKLATFMTEKHHPIIRKYQQLAARDLLLLQAELCHLECEYAAVVKQNSTFKDERKSYDQDWLLMHTAPTRGFSTEQWDISLATRAKLREYCKLAIPILPNFLLPKVRSKLAFKQILPSHSIPTLHQSDNPKIRNGQS